MSSMVVPSGTVYSAVGGISSGVLTLSGGAHNHNDKGRVRKVGFHALFHLYRVTTIFYFRSKCEEGHNDLPHFLREKRKKKEKKKKGIRCGWGKCVCVCVWGGGGGIK